MHCGRYRLLCKWNSFFLLFSSIPHKCQCRINETTVLDLLLPCKICLYPHVSRTCVNGTSPFGTNRFWMFVVKQKLPSAFRSTTSGDGIFFCVPGCCCYSFVNILRDSCWQMDWVFGCDCCFKALSQVQECTKYAKTENNHDECTFE